MKKFDYVEVVWIDAQSSMDILPVSQLEKHPLAITKSCGYLVRKDKNKVVLAFMLFGEDSNEEVLMKHYQVIPIGMVKKINKLFEPHGTIKRKGKKKVPVKYMIVKKKDGTNLGIIQDKKKILDSKKRKFIKHNLNEKRKGK